MFCIWIIELVKLYKFKWKNIWLGCKKGIMIVFWSWLNLMIEIYNVNNFDCRLKCLVVLDLLL